MSVSDPLLPRLRRFESSSPASTNRLSTLNGVYIPCMMNILGIILFMRLSWAIGQAGWLTIVLLFVLGETAAILTVLSMSALVSTGKMKGGGSYFLISRCLGPEIGGAIGVFFYLAYAVGTSFYVVSLGTEIVDAFYDDLLENEREKLILIFSSIALWIITLISYIGASSFAKINKLVFSLQLICILFGLTSIYFFSTLPSISPSSHSDVNQSFIEENPKSMTELFYMNMYSNYTIDKKCGDSLCTTSLIFGIIFNAITGIMEGANLSGDLANPTKSIPKGTLYAILSAMILYLVLIFSFATHFDKETLRENSNLLEKITQPSHYITVLGVLIAAFSAALGSLFGGARVLQALGKDNLPPNIGLSFFAKGREETNEPQRAVLFTFLVAQLCTFIGDLDTISPIIASFFLITYASVNLTCLLLDISGIPNFRPTFRFFSRKQSFVGLILCLTLMIYLNPNYALFAILLVAFLVSYISYQLYHFPELQKNWGDVSQALIYYQVRHYIYRLDRNKHPKHWRPSLLFLLPSSFNQANSSSSTYNSFQDENEIVELLHFGNVLKRNGLFITGQVVLKEETEVSKESFHLFFKQHSIKAISNILLSESYFQGYYNLASLSGLGGLTPNTVLVSLTCLSQFKANEFDEFLSKTLKLKKNVLIASNFNSNTQMKLDKPLVYSNVVILSDNFHFTGTLTLQIQLAFIYSEKQKRQKIRFLSFIKRKENIVNTLAKLKDLAEMARIPKDKVRFKVIVIEEKTYSQHLEQVIEQDLTENKRNAVFFYPMEASTITVKEMNIELPRVVYTCLGEENSVISLKL